MRKPLLERFMEKVEQTDSCWNWTGSLSPDGYGRIMYLGKNENAHRVAYLLLIGPIPDGAHIRHSCDNRRCVNPAHLSPGTHRDNMDDMTSRGRRRMGTALRRSDGLPVIAKLTADSIKEIHERRARGETQRQIAAAIGVSQTCVSTCLRGETAYAKL